MMGRPVVLLQDLEVEESGAPAPARKVAATYCLDIGLSKLSLVPRDQEDTGSPHSQSITLLIDNIQVICAASDFMCFLDQFHAKLDEEERARAVLLQYVTEDTVRRRICFLEDSEVAKEKFVKAMTALWLEKRNDGSGFYL